MKHLRLQSSLTLLLLAVLTVAGCKKGPSWKSATFEEKKVKPQTGEMQVPASLWERISPTATSAVKKDGDDAKPELALEPLKVYLIEKNKGVLKGQNLALSFVAGGGSLNLPEYVQPLRGSFYLAYEFLPEIENADVKVHFISNSVIRKLSADETAGSGCDKYFDLTKFSSAAMKKDGFLLNTSDQRHVSALAGTYLFTSSYDGKLHMATLVIEDSDHRALQCRR